MHTLVGRLWELRENLSGYDASYAGASSASRSSRTALWSTVEAGATLVPLVVELGRGGSPGSQAQATWCQGEWGSSMDQDGLLNGRVSRIKI